MTDITLTDANGSLTCVAFYLPQFHPIPENDEFWGTGFSEWHNVVSGRPIYDSHYQPHLPGDLGFYDLRAAAVQVSQAEMARSHGIGAFCYYYYWFSGREVMTAPLRSMMSNTRIDLPFLICWANESWTRRWDGRDDDVLIEQIHDPETDATFIDHVMPILADDRYFRINGRPLLLVYRPELMPEPVRTTEAWRKAASKAGLGELELASVQSFRREDPRSAGFDSAVEFPPIGFDLPDISSALPALSPDFVGGVHSYEHLVRVALERTEPEYPLYRGVTPAWDNTARRGHAASILHGSSPELFETWLSSVVLEERAKTDAGDRVIFINAWNEWAEGCHLEPDRRHGNDYLRATRRASRLATQPNQGHDDYIPDLESEVKALRRVTSFLSTILDEHRSALDVLVAGDRWNPAGPPNLEHAAVPLVGEMNVEAFSASPCPVPGGDGPHLVVSISGWFALPEIDPFAPDARLHAVLIDTDTSETFFAPIREKTSRADVSLTLDGHRVQGCGFTVSAAMLPRQDATVAPIVIVTHLDRSVGCASTSSFGLPAMLIAS